MATCTSCGATIRFARHVNTRRQMPVDATPSVDGNLILFDQDGELLVRHASLPADSGKLRFKAHFATCPHADRHRRKR